MSNSIPPDSPVACPKCGSPFEEADVNGFCHACLMAEVMQPSGTKGRWEPPTATELAALLPQYEIDCLLGRGGMGAVYKGRQKSLDRAIAVKILPAEVEDLDPAFIERFKNEARAMAKLSHPGIVAVYDSGETSNGLLFIVMEYIEGTDVARMISQSGRLHTEYAMAITAHVCDALAYAHERGIIHRDIKPANIMVGNDGAVKVADFGLAKIYQGAEMGLTQSGTVMGTLHFMAPEALTLGNAVDQRADIYAVGVMLYQMLTGKLPQGLFELPSMQIKGLDPRYDGIIAKALREDREVRYQHAVEMRHDLDAILTQPVVKVEAAQRAATYAPPRAVHEQPRRQPPQRSDVRVKRKGSLLLWLGFVSVFGAAAWLYWNHGEVLALSSAASPNDVPERLDSLSPPVSLSVGTKDQPLVNSLGMKFVPVPGTKVMFCIHETRRQDYQAYAAAVPDIERSWEGQMQDGVPVGHEDDHPVVAVSWNEARAFCSWLSKKEGRTYRLPTDREWSFAVGIGPQEAEIKNPESSSPPVALLNVFPWNGSYPPPPSTGNFNDTAHKLRFPQATTIEGYTDGFTTTAPVMSFKPNALGIYDLSGNVWEWCEELYSPSHYAPSVPSRVLRGGCWDNVSAGRLLSACRDHREPDGHFNIYGFRIVLEMSAPESPKVSNSAPSTADRQTFGGSQYAFVTGDFTWEDSRTKAEQMGGHLAMISSRDENDWIIRTYSDRIPEERMHFWLGGKEESLADGWKWITGERFAFEGWKKGEPNRGGGKVTHYLNMYRTKEGEVGWNDRFAGDGYQDGQAGFLVEWDLKPAALSSSSSLNIDTASPAKLTPDQQNADAVWRSRWSKPGRLKLHAEGVTSPVTIAAAEAYDDIVYVAGVAPGTKAGILARWIALRANGELVGNRVNLTQGQRYVGVVMGYNSAPDVLIREGGLPEARGRLLREKPVLQVRAFRMAAVLALPETSQDAEVFALQNTDRSWSLLGTPIEKKLLAVPDVSSDRSIQDISLSDLGVAVVHSDGNSRLYGKTEVLLSPALFNSVKEVRFGKQICYALGKNGVLTYLKVLPSGAPDYANPSIQTDVAEFYGGHMANYWRLTSGQWAAHTPDLPMMNKLNELKPDFFFLALGANGDLLFWIEPK